MHVFKDNTDNHKEKANVVGSIYFSKCINELPWNLKSNKLPASLKHVSDQGINKVTTTQKFEPDEKKTRTCRQKCNVWFHFSDTVMTFSQSTLNLKKQTKNN